MLEMTCTNGVQNTVSIIITFPDDWGIGYLRNLWGLFRINGADHPRRFHCSIQSQWQFGLQTHNGMKTVSRISILCELLTGRKYW